MACCHQGLSRWTDVNFVIKRVLWHSPSSNFIASAQDINLQIHLEMNSWKFRLLTHWGRVTHIWVGNLTTIVSDNGLSPGRCQALIPTNAGIPLIEPLATNFNEILIEMHIFSFKENPLQNVVWKLAAILSRPQCVKVVALPPGTSQSSQCSTACVMLQNSH